MLTTCCCAGWLQAPRQTADAAAVGNTLYRHLGPLFMEFKGRPALCAMYPAIKLASRVAKGALLGLFYGGLQLTVSTGLLARLSRAGLSADVSVE